MSFTPNIPASGQTLGQTRQAILDNFAILRSTLSTDHIDVNTSGNGKHKWARFPAQSTIPATIANEIMLVNKNSNLFLRQANSSNDIQLAFGNLSGTDLTRFGTFTNIGAGNTAGWVSLPGGLMLQYGTRATSSNPGTTTITFPVSFNSSANVYSVSVTAIASSFGANDDLTAAVRSINGSGASMLVGTSSSGNVSAFYWMAIGLKP